MSQEKVLDEIREMGHQLGWQRALEVCARIAEERVYDQELDTMKLQHPVEIAASIRALPGGAGADKGMQDSIYRSYLAKMGLGKQA